MVHNISTFKWIRFTSSLNLCEEMATGFSHGISRTHVQLATHPSSNTAQLAIPVSFTLKMPSCRALSDLARVGRGECGSESTSERSNKYGIWIPCTDPGTQPPRTWPLGSLAGYPERPWDLTWPLGNLGPRTWPPRTLGANGAKSLQEP